MELLFVATIVSAFQIMYVVFYSLFSGVTVRTAWIALGGAVFFGVYEKAKNVLQDKLENQ